VTISILSHALEQLRSIRMKPERSQALMMHQKINMTAKTVETPGLLNDKTTPTSTLILHILNVVQNKTLLPNTFFIHPS
jgi:hypothetical protein